MKVLKCSGLMAFFLVAGCRQENLDQDAAKAGSIAGEGDGESRSAVGELPAAGETSVEESHPAVPASAEQSAEEATNPILAAYTKHAGQGNKDAKEALAGVEEPLKSSPGNGGSPGPVFRLSKAMNLALNTRVFPNRMVRIAIASLVWLPIRMLCRLTCVLTMISAPVDLPAQGPGTRLAFVAPNFSKALFDLDSVFLEPGELRVVTNALAALAANFPGDSRIVPGLRAKALAISLRLDGAHRDSALTLRKLKDGETPSPVAGFDAPAVAVFELWQLAEALDRADASRDDHLLACYLMDIAMLIDPARPGGSARFKKLSKKGKFLGWQDVIAVVNVPLAQPPAEAGPADANPVLPSGKEKILTDEPPVTVEQVQKPEDPQPGPGEETEKATVE
jgi:hypothetical protein